MKNPKTKFLKCIRNGSTNSMERSSQQLIFTQLVTKSFVFYKTRSSLHCSQEPAKFPYPERDESNSHPPILNRSQICPLIYVYFSSLQISESKLYMHLSFPMRATHPAQLTILNFNMLIKFYQRWVAVQNMAAWDALWVSCRQILYIKHFSVFKGHLASNDNRKDLRIQWTWKALQQTNVRTNEVCSLIYWRICLGSDRKKCWNNTSDCSYKNRKCQRLRADITN